MIDQHQYGVGLITVMALDNGAVHAVLGDSVHWRFYIRDIYFAVCSYLVSLPDLFNMSSIGVSSG